MRSAGAQTLPLLGPVFFDQMQQARALLKEEFKAKAAAGFHPIRLEGALLRKAEVRTLDGLIDFCYEALAESGAGFDRVTREGLYYLIYLSL